MMKLAALWGASALFACTGVSDTSTSDGASDADAAIADLGAVASAQALDVAARHRGLCASSPQQRLFGSAGRSNDNGYPDQLDAEVTWTLVDTTGCVDTYAPSGTVRYGFAIPGALCDQSIDPPSHAIAASDGVLTIDRSTSPPTIAMHGETRWPVTWTCLGDSGSTQTQSLTGGGAWLDATELAGSNQRTDATRCGSPNGTPPCTYRWNFAG